MAIAALLISILAALFAGVMALLAFREQRLRLRPQVYIDRIKTNVSSNLLTFQTVIQNVGLLPAKNMTISPVLKVNNAIIELSDEARRSKAIVIPKQKFENPMQVSGKTKDAILKGSATLHAEIRVDYEANGKEYYFWARYEFNSERESWTILDGDAN